MNYYISDLHFGHKNVIKFDDRPFADVEEMDETLIANWNRKVKEEDHVYIIGDFCCHNEKPEEWYLEQLKGRKHLVIGNHDKKLLENAKAMAHFESVDKMMHVSDGGKEICLCHFPIAEWNGFYKGSWHIYGHIHWKKNEAFVHLKSYEKALNASACINQYVPCTIDELIENNRMFKKSYAVSCMPTYLPTEDIWAVNTAHGVECGSINYVLSEFGETGLVYHFNNFYHPEPQNPNHVHGFDAVLVALVEDYKNFSVEHFQAEYSAQELEMLRKVQERLRRIGKSRRVSFHEFHRVMMKLIIEKFPNAEFRIVKGGDFIQDVIMEAWQGEKKIRYKPAELYQKGYESNDFEGVISEFLELCSREIE